MYFFMFQKNKFLDKAALPEWTKGQSAITMPLNLPENGQNLGKLSLNSECECLICDDKKIQPRKYFGTPFIGSQHCRI